MAEDIKIKGVYKNLFEIQQAGLKFTKDTEGVFNSKYVTLDALNEKLLPELKKHKLVVLHQTQETEKGFVVKTFIVDTEDGSSVASEFPLSAELEPQKAGGAISYAKRYNLGQLFNIITDEDDDGAASSPVNSKGGFKV